MTVRPSPVRRMGAVGAAGAAALLVAGLTGPAFAAQPPAPAIALSAGYLSGAVGAIGDPGVGVDVAQAGAPAASLKVTVTASSDPAVARVGDVRVDRTRDGRRLTVHPRGRGHTELTVTVTGRGGKSAAATLGYAASARVSTGAAGTRYLTGSSDASAAVDAGGGYALVADDESNVLRLYDRSRSGAPVRTWDLGPALGVKKEVDIEAAARVGDTVYWTGSLGNKKDGTYKAERNTVFTTKITGSGAATEVTFTAAYKGLREDLIAWDTAHAHRYGFAAGTAAGQVPKRIDGNAADQYLILAGSWAADDKSDPYALYSWDGVPGHAPKKRADLPTADPGGWEAVVAVPDLRVPGARVQLITDSGSADLYGDGAEAKDLGHPEWKKSRSAWFTLDSVRGGHR
ncbi:hypothetical protein [Streptomyces sp. G-G2]|uniref:hypothetical protein n=1 Tax=Streptomyces sp. G-G2 TaxID=3046201 RepID=UPI0024B8FD59|nr:hypothetical protein [Streptomyces sp. G-G2]MDJ0381330.1 hypothetical protein [Streptomyces sp. G-G2]